MDGKIAFDIIMEIGIVITAPRRRGERPLSSTTNKDILHIIKHKAHRKTRKLRIYSVLYCFIILYKVADVFFLGRR